MNSRILEFTSWSWSTCLRRSCNVLWIIHCILLLTNQCSYDLEVSSFSLVEVNIFNIQHHLLQVRGCQLILADENIITKTQSWQTLTLTEMSCVGDQRCFYILMLLTLSYLVGEMGHFMLGATSREMAREIGLKLNDYEFEKIMNSRLRWPRLHVKSDDERDKQRGQFWLQDTIITWCLSGTWTLCLGLHWSWSWLSGAGRSHLHRSLLCVWSGVWSGSWLCQQVPAAGERGAGVQCRDHDHLRVHTVLAPGHGQDDVGCRVTIIFTRTNDHI